MTQWSGWNFALLFMAMLCRIEVASAEELPISLISYDGQRPIALAPNDPLAESVGVLFTSPEQYAKRDPSTDGYATAFLISECYALAGSRAVEALPESIRSFGGSTYELLGVRFGIGLKPGSEPGALTEASFRVTWPVTVRLVVPEEVDRERFGLTPWSLLHLEGCETDAKDNGKPIPSDPVTSLELQESGLPAAARHVGVLMTDRLSIVELPNCQIFGQMRGLSWESTCSSWLGMTGGPVLTFDPSRKAWTAVGFIPAGNLSLFLAPTESLSSGKRDFHIYSVDEKNPRYFEYMTNVVPLAQVWPWIRDLVEGDNPGLTDPNRAGVIEQEVDLRQSLAMQMQERPESAWSAFDYTRFGLGLEALGLDEDAVKYFKSAIAADPTYLPAALRLSRKIDWLGPQGITDAELQTMRDAMGEAIARYPEDPQLILRRIYIEKKLALHKDVLADGEKYLSVEIRFPGSSSFYVDRGDAFLAVGDLDGAQATFAEAYKLDAMNEDAIRGLARIKLYRGDIDNALRLAEKSVRIEPKDARSKTILAIARAQSGDVDGAIAVMEEACEQFAPSATPYAYLALLRGYRRALAGDFTDTSLIALEELAKTADGLWPHQVVEIFAGIRSLESLAGFDYSNYTPDWRRTIDIGRLVFGAAFDLSQGRSIDYPTIEKNMQAHRDQNFAHLAPILKHWASIVAAAKQ